MAGASSHSTRSAGKECDVCGRRFARNEHLIRHRRTHTNEKPFQCQHCHMSFPRADVKEKHLKRYHAPDENGADVDENLAKKLTSARQERSRQACDECRSRKLKCDNVHPCRSCRSKKLECKVSSDRKGPGRPRREPTFSPARPSTTSVSPPGSKVLGGLDGDAFLKETTTVPSSFSADASGALTNVGLGLPAVVPIMDPNQLLQYENVHPFNTLDLSLTTGSMDFGSNTAFTNQGWGDMSLADGSWHLPLEYDPFIEHFGDLAYGTESWFPMLPSISTTAKSPMETAITLMKEHFSKRSVSSNPSTAENAHPWYSVPPRLQIYDESIINIFLNLARNHLADSFSLFANFEARPGMRQELCLAMAAVGGLFCSVDGSAKINKALYNDARRMLLASFYKGEVESFDATMTAAMTCILLEIYGMCSGDKRTYELAEAFHPLVLLSVRSCRLLLPNGQYSTEHQQYDLLAAAAQVLESYRVLFLLLPPTYGPFYRSRIIRNGPQAHETVELRYLSHLLHPSAKSEYTRQEISHVALLSCYSWLASPHGLERPGQNPLWKLDFIELAFDRWKQESETETSHSQSPQMLLYHMAHIAMHSNLGFLQRFAHNSAKLGTAIGLQNLPKSIRKWTKEGHLKIATWHADSIMAIAAKVIGLSAPAHAEPPTKAHSFEPPHLAYCTYFACLITWYESLCSNDGERDVRVRTGAGFLFAMKLRVAKVLGEALCELLSDAAEPPAR